MIFWLPKRSAMPALAERLGAHAEALVERDGRRDVGDGQHEVVERGDAHAGTVRPPRSRAGTVGAVTGNVLDGWDAVEYGRSRQGVALRVFMPAGDGPIAGLVTAAQHGEEAVTALLARRLMERVPGAARRPGPSCPSSIPDGLLAGTRQNDAGVDLNRNFPAATWLPDESFTYPPGIERGAAAARAPHEPLIAGRARRIRARDPGADRADRAPAAAARDRSPQPARGAARAPRTRRRPSSSCSRASAGLPVIDEIEGCPGAFDDWLDDNGIPAIVYEIEQGGLPEICARHLPGLEALLRGVAVRRVTRRAALRLEGTRRARRPRA